MGTKIDVRKIIEDNADLPVMSNVIGKILELTRNEDVQLNKIADIVKKDIALSSKILRVVNSSFYGFSRNITTISQALVILGLDSIKNLSLSLSIVDAFQSAQKKADYKKFWKASFYSATSARLIAKHTQYKDLEEVFVAALIHDLGTLLFSIYFPEKYKELCDSTVEKVVDNTAQEEKIFKINHTEAGEILSLKWQLPERLTNVIRYHHSIHMWDVFPEEQKTLLKIIYLSDILSKAYTEKDKMGKNLINFGMEAKRLFDINEEDANIILEQTNTELEENVKFFELDLKQQKSHTEIIIEANKELAKINLSYEQIMHNIYERNVAVDHSKKLESKKQVEILTKETNEDGAFKGMIGNSVEMLKLFSTIKEVSKYSSTILINGDTGTGKELVASAIHELSPRNQRKYVAFNIASIPDNLVESELFGHEKGAFTGADVKKIGLFEAAHNGSIFLDEIGELSTQTQVSLLRVLEKREVRRVGSTDPIPIDVRVITATNRNLMEEVKKGNFREDLFYRLHVVAIKLLKLNERKEDILPLCEFYLKKFNQKFNKNVTIPDHILNVFLNYPWEGNVRELVNIVESAVIQSQGAVTVENLPPAFRGFSSEVKEEEVNEYGTLEDIEKKHIRRILKMLDGNKVKAAKVLGLGRSSLYRKIDKYGFTEYL